jgi:hypothetical protein
VVTVLPTGFAIIRGALSARRCEQLALLTDSLGIAGPGSRCLLSYQWCRQLAIEVRQARGLADLIPESHSPVQCTYFEKSTENNWLVPIHQDLSLPAPERTPLPGWGPWSEKEGATFVQPPVAVLEQLLAVRIHLDPCGVTDGPLHVVPGTHLQGVIRPENAAALRIQEQACLAQVGDALVFRPLLLHRSSKSSGASRRRVLHFLYAPPSAALDVEWPSAA